MNYHRNCLACAGAPVPADAHTCPYCGGQDWAPTLVVDAASAPRDGTAPASASSQPIAPPRRGR